MEMSKRIKERRLAMGYTQEELATTLGLQKSAIAKYENGRVENIKRSVISKMATVLDCSPSYLLGFTDDAEEDYLNNGECKTLQLVFNELGYSLKPYSTPGNYTLRHNKETDFIVVISEYELKTMIYDISDYVGVLVSKKFESMLSSIRSRNEINAAHDRTDRKVTEADIKHDEDIMNDDNF